MHYGIMSELESLKNEVSSLKEELEVMKDNVRDLNEQLYQSYKRIKGLYTPAEKQDEN